MIASLFIAISLVFMGVFMATPAHALGPNAIVPGFNTTNFGPNDDGTYPCIGPDNGDPTPTCANPPAPVTLPFTLNFFGTNYSQLFLNNNGNVTFDSRLADFTPFNLFTAGRVIIAPFFADVDTRNPSSALVTYGSSPDGKTFCVDWVGVGYYSEHADKFNSFQLLLTDRSDVSSGDFDITFNYGPMTWETGDADGGTGGIGGIPARAGFSAGTGNPGSSDELAGAGVTGALLDGGAQSLAQSSRNAGGVPGRDVFTIRN